MQKHKKRNYKYVKIIILDKVIANSVIIEQIFDKLNFKIIK